ncbi:hypothetical protein IGI04_007493, partial [Brassica rapa subsp. trilocularis]
SSPPRASSSLQWRFVLLLRTVKSICLYSIFMLSCSYAVNCLANLNRICHVCIRYKVSTEALEQYIMLGMCFGSSLGENVSAENLLSVCFFSRISKMYVSFQEFQRYRTMIARDFVLLHDSAGDLLSCSYTVLDKTNSIDGTVPEQVKFQSEVKKLQQEQFRPAEQVSISSQEMLQYIALE